MAIERTMTFSGKGRPGDLYDPNNWVGGVAPGINDGAVIEMNVGGPVGGTLTSNNMMLLGNETITFTGTLNLAGIPAPYGTLLVGESGGCQGLMVCDGANAVFAPGATVNDGNILVVGNDAVGTLVAEGSGTAHSIINSVTLDVSRMDDGVGIVTIDDGVLNISAIGAIGDEGAGTLNVIDNGSANFSGGLGVAGHAGSTGQVTIASGGSVNVERTLWVGENEYGPAGTATVSVGSGSSLVVDQAIYIGSGSQIDLAGGTVAGGAVGVTIGNLAGGLISGYGTLAVPDGEAIVNNGIIRAAGGNLQMLEGVIGTGSLQIAADSTATINGITVKLAGISFIGPNATLSLAHGAIVTSPISGFAVGDIIAMANVTAATFTASTGMLALSDNGVKVDSLHLLGSFTGDTFAVQQTLSDSLISLHHN
jgi:hypothetical protein